MGCLGKEIEGANSREPEAGEPLEIAGKGRESRYNVRWQSAHRAFERLEEFVMTRRDGEPGDEGD